MKYKELISELYACANECNACFEACLKEKDVEKLERCMQLDEECYDICELTARMLERGSEHKDLFLSLCAQICIACADECETHHHDHCMKCAAACRTCAEKCIANESEVKSWE
ncbi:MAG: four-helix bundle copper-binding protein [Bacteroidota bacterium]